MSQSHVRGQATLEFKDPQLCPQRDTSPDGSAEGRLCLPAPGFNVFLSAAGGGYKDAKVREGCDQL